MTSYVLTFSAAEIGGAHAASNAFAIRIATPISHDETEPPDISNGTERPRSRPAR